MTRVLLVSEFGRADQNSTGHLVSLIPALLDGAEVEVLDITSMPRPFLSLFAATGARQRLHVLSRLVALLGLLAGAVARRGRHDVVIVGSNPFLSFLAPSWLWRRRPARLFYLTFDLFPETLGATDMQVSPWMVKLLLRIRNRNFRRADGVLAIGADMQRHLEGLGVAAVHYAPLWVTGEEPAPPSPEPAAPSLHFFGNMGRVQDFQQLFDILRQNSTVTLDVYGDGVKAREFAQTAPHQVRFHGGVPFARRASAYGGRIVGVVPQSPRLEGLAVPSKASYYWARGIPILFLGSPTSELGRLIRETPAMGLSVAPGAGVDGLAGALAALAANDGNPAVRAHSQALADRARAAIRQMVGLAP